MGISALWEIVGRARYMDRRHFLHCLDPKIPELCSDRYDGEREVLYCCGAPDYEEL